MINTLTIQDKIIDKFDKQFGIDWTDNELRLPDLYQPKVKSNEVKQFLKDSIKLVQEETRKEDIEIIKNYFTEEHLIDTKQDGIWNDLIELILDDINELSITNKEKQK